MTVVDSPEDYCRQLESYLCRKNDGHLIRIVGPAFEQVCGWATRGIPFKVACRGIDRYFERYYAKGPRRRPVRIEFCEADVLDAFDEWRRAVGVPAVEPGDGDSEETRRQPSLPAHLERVIAGLTALRAGPDRSLGDLLDPVVQELDSAKAAAKNIRGDARDRLLERLRVLERGLLQSARARLDAEATAAIEREAETELAPFRDRMPPEAYRLSREACIDRIVRERTRLPVLTFE